MVNVALGYVACLIATIFFGSNFLPTKMFPTGDGMAFQFFQCTGTLMVGIFVFIYQYYTDHQPPVVVPFAMLGGFLWCTGNIMVVPIVRTIGLALGLVIWGSANLLCGYFSGRFGLFGLDAQEPAKPGLSSAGIAVAVLSIMVASLVESNTAGGKAESEEEEDKKKAGAVGDGREQSLLGGQSYDGAGSGAIIDSIGGASSIDHSGLGQGNGDLYGGQAAEVGAINGAAAPGALEVQATKAGQSQQEGGPAGQDESFVTDALPKTVQRILGILMSLASGLLYGSCFDPPQYNANKSAWIHDHPNDAGHKAKQHRWVDDSATLSDYILSQFLGIWLTSLVYFLIYCVATCNKPRIFPQTTAPAVSSGILWAVAQAAWFVANENLSYPESFPLVCLGPGMVASLWGVFLFGEISGTRNYLLLCANFALAIGAVTMIVLSSGNS